MRFAKFSFAGLVAISIASGCHKKAAPEKPIQAVRVESVENVVSRSLTPYSGNALAQTQVDLSFKGGGYVDTIATVKDKHGKSRALQAGDPVEKGMVLASLRQGDYRAKLAEASGVQSEAGSAFVAAKEEYTRAQKLYDKGAMSKAELDGIKARYGSAAGAVTAAGGRATAASLALSDARPKAPFDGIILARGIELGALVGPGSVAFTIADTRTMRVAFGVPDSVQRALEVDKQVLITTDAVPGRTFTGTLTKIAVQADPKTRVFEVEATVDNADQALKVGMVMQVQLDLAKSGPTPSALIPLSAVVRPPNAPAEFGAFVVSSDKGAEVAHIRTIKLGDLVANRVAVTEGLSVGDRLVIQGATLLTDGERVSVVP
jgi:multidrug efflux system membrane fusion protein